MKKATRSNRITQIGELQLQVFDILCQLGEGTVYDVQDEFPEAERPRYTTPYPSFNSVTSECQSGTYMRPQKSATNLLGRATVQATGQYPTARKYKFRETIQRCYKRPPVLGPTMTWPNEQAFGWLGACSLNQCASTIRLKQHTLSSR